MATRRLFSSLRVRRGMIAVQVALSLTALMAVVAIAVDGGILMAERRHAQATADAAALAAAADFYKKWNTNLGADLPLVNSVGPAATSALTTASSNGYLNDAVSTSGTSNNPGTSTVTVQVNPSNYLGGPNAGNPVPKGYAEVTVTYYQGRYFSHVLGSGTIPISARAVARGTVVNLSILTLNSAASGTSLSLTGSTLGSAVSPVPEAIFVNSSSSSGLKVDGTSHLTGKVIKVVGSAASILGSATPTPTTGVTATYDPLGPLGQNLQPPSYATYGGIPQTPVSILGGVPTTTWNGYNPALTSAYNAPTGSPAVSTTIYPGRYVGINVVSGASVTMSPGIYYLTGINNSTFTTLQVSGATASLTGSGVLIYNGELLGDTTHASGVGKITFKSSAVVDLTPMSSGTWKGISIFQDRNATTATVTLTGGSGTNITGVVYAASAAITASGGTNIVPGSAFISNTFTFGGGGTTLLPEPALKIPVPGPGGSKVGLVE